MNRHTPEPRNAAALRRAFPTYVSRMEAADPVMVSLCADTGKFTGRWVVFAEPGRAYDWSALRRLSVCVLVRKGIDATPTVRALWDIVHPYVVIADADSGDQAAVLQLSPKLKLWPMTSECPTMRRAA
jgi:hypothetical protein